jgi:threonine aldolase
MRQIGILAAAVDYALTHNVDRLAQDHLRAQAIALACAEVSSDLIDPKLAHTNIVAINLRHTNKNAPELVAELRERGILAGAMGSHLLRLVTHMDFDDMALEEVVKVLPELLKRALVAK